MAPLSSNWHPRGIRFLRRVRRFLNRKGLRSRKVFAIGLNKSGTTSLHAMFHAMGHPSLHGPAWADQDDPAALRRFDCFSDDQPKDLSKLDRAFPRAKFILQVRELESWVYSRLAHIDRRRTEPNYWIGPNWDTTVEAIEDWVRKRNHYHLLVLDYFAERPDDLLLVNFIRDQDAAEKIACFFRYGGPLEKRRKNINPVPNRAEHEELVERAFARLGITAEERQYDLYCPGLLDQATLPAFPPDTSMIILKPPRPTRRMLPRLPHRRSS